MIDNLPYELLLIIINNIEKCPDLTSFLNTCKYTYSIYLNNNKYILKHYKKCLLSRVIRNKYNDIKYWDDKKLLYPNTISPFELIYYFEIGMVANLFNPKYYTLEDPTFEFDKDNKDYVIATFILIRCSDIIKHFICNVHVYEYIIEYQYHATQIGQNIKKEKIIYLWPEIGGIPIVKLHFYNIIAKFKIRSIDKDILSISSFNINLHTDDRRKLVLQHYIPFPTVNNLQ